MDIRRKGHGVVPLALLFASHLVSAQSWRQINSGLPVTVEGVRALTFDPGTPSVAYAVTATGSLFKTSDGGGSWKAISTATSVNSVIVDPKNSANVYAATWRGILKSADYGETWATANTGLQFNYIIQLVIAPTDPPVLYALNSGGLSKSTDGAQTWRSLNATFYEGSTTPVPFPHVALTRVAVDPNNPSTMYVSGYGSIAEIFKSTDGGTTWYRAATPLPTMSFEALPVFNPGAPSNVYLWYSDYNFQTKTGGGHLLQSTDDGASWSEIGNGGAPPDSDLYSMAFDPRSPFSVYASYSTLSQGWGVVKSTDGGKSWTQLNTGLPPYQANSVVAVSPDATIYAGYVDLSIERGRLVRSTDGGATWSAADSGLTYIDVRALAIDPANASSVYAGVGGGGEGIFKTTDRGAHWANLSQLQIGAAVPVDPLLPQTEPAIVKSLVIDFADSKVLYAATGRLDKSCFYTDQPFFTSADGGASWDNIANPPQGGCGFFSASPQVMALAPTNSNELYVGGADDCGDSFLDQSADAGTDWNALPLGNASAVNAVLADPANSSTLFAGTPQGVFKSNDHGAHWNNTLSVGAVALAMDPTHPNTVYAATGDPYGSALFQGVYKSTDGGGSWSAINTGLDAVFASGSVATGIAVDPRNPSTLYLAISGSGIYKSSDGGSHWTPFNEGLGNLDVRVIALASNGPNRVYASTHGGVFTIVDEPQTQLTPRR